MSAGEHAEILNGIKSTLRVIPDFPKQGIMFLDITTLLLHPKAFKDTIDLFVGRYKHKNISVVAGLYKYNESIYTASAMVLLVNLQDGLCIFKMAMVEMIYEPM
nr:adenine phosphoribosyl transferase [Tanacetum cinerariifolium]